MPQSSSHSFKSDIMRDLRYCLLPGKYCGLQHQSIYSDLFKFWQHHWSNAFLEIGVPFSMTSDEFCRHEEVTCLVYKNRIVACALLDYFDLESTVHKAQHYFLNYPEDILNKITALSAGHPVLSFGYLAVAPEFRGKFRLSDIILGLALVRMNESVSSLMISYTRNTRKTNDLTYRLGAKAIVRGLEIRGEPSDFVYFTGPDNSTLKSHDNYSQIKSLWHDKIFIPSNSNAQTPIKGRPYERDQFGLSF